ncbi:uncharacterized protein LOC144327821 isoform X2 [Podarcis muralis]
MAPLTCSFGGPSLSPPPLLLLLLFLSSRVRATTPTVPTIKPGNTTVTPGAPKPPTTEDGGEGAVDPGPGPGSQTTLPPDDIESDNTAIIVENLKLLLALLNLMRQNWNPKVPTWSSLLQ